MQIGHYPHEYRPQNSGLFQKLGYAHPRFYGVRSLASLLPFRGDRLRWIPPGRVERLPRRRNVCLILCALTFGVAGVAHASPLSFEDVYNPTDVQFSRTGLHTLAFTHDLTHAGFDPASDTLTSVNLSLFFHDDGDPSAEKVDITLDQLWTVNNATIASGAGPTLFTFDVATLVAPDGKLNVLLSRQNGTFYFEKSVLDAAGTRGGGGSTVPVPATPVAEPASMLLLGSGLVALGLRRWYF